MTKLTVTIWGETDTITLEKTSYSNNGNLAIVATDEEGMPWGNITVNTHVKLPENMACVDTNNIPGIVNILNDAGIAKLTDKTINPGGFVDYPVMIFDLSKL